MSPAGDEGYLAFLSVERISFPAQGRHGGQAGAAGRIRIDEDGPDLPSKGEWQIKPGQTLIFETPGGGGIGSPRDRDHAAVQRDCDEGLISAGAARDIYWLDP